MDITEDFLPDQAHVGIHFREVQGGIPCFTKRERRMERSREEDPERGTQRAQEAVEKALEG